MPRAVDSLLALTRLDQTIVRHTLHMVQENPSKQLELGLRLARLPTSDAGARREDARYARSVQRELEGVRYDALTQDDYLTLSAVYWDLANDIEAPVYHSLDFTSLMPGASAIPAIARALAQHPIEDDQDLARYLYLLDNLGRFFWEKREQLRDQAAAGITIPLVALDSVIAFLNTFRQAGMASPFALESERLTLIDSLSRPSIVAALTREIDSDLRVQLDSLIMYVDGAYRAQLTDTASTVPIGLGRYPGGREYYQYLLRRITTLEVAPADLYRYGLQEVERIVTAMSVLRATLGFGGSDSAFRESVRTGAEYVIESPNDFEQRVIEALHSMRDSVRSRWGMELPDSISLVQRASQTFDGARLLNVVEKGATGAGWRLEYAADRITRLPAYVIPALVAREILPGRFALLSAIQRHDSLPTIRQLMRFPGFVDGWSEHARAMAGELGLYSDGHVAYGALMLELEAAARMVADVGLHYYGWTYREAVRYLRLYSVDASSASSDVLRIAVSEPARAVAAKVGSRELAGQRAWVRRQLGTQFDDGALQRELFRIGALPLPLLSQHLTWFVWKAKQSPEKQGSGSEFLDRKARSKVHETPN